MTFPFPTSGLTPSAVNRYVNGNRVPSIEVAERICAALGEMIVKVFDE